MKIIICLLLCSLNSYGMLTYPLMFGVGFESCHPNSEGLTVCEGMSPQTSELKISIEPVPESVASYGYHVKWGIYQNIGYEASVTITHFSEMKADDILTLKLVTWALNTPGERHEVKMEVFADRPENLNRVNLIGQAIGTDDDFSNIILSVNRTNN